MELSGAKYRAVLFWMMFIMCRNMLVYARLKFSSPHTIQPDHWHQNTAHIYLNPAKYEKKKCAEDFFNTILNNNKICLDTGTKTHSHL